VQAQARGAPPRVSDKRERRHDAAAAAFRCLPTPGALQRGQERAKDTRDIAVAMRAGARQSASASAIISLLMEMANSAMMSVMREAQNGARGVVMRERAQEARAAIGECAKDAAMRR